jgi:hypothetical protein
MTFSSTSQFLIIFGMGFEVLTVVRIHNVVLLGHYIVWYVRGYECFGGAFWVCLQGASDYGCSRSRPNRLC